MDTQGTTRAFQRLLTNWNFDLGSSWPEDFAISRYQKKMEVPDNERARERRQACLDDYIEYDQSLRSPPGFLPRKWYIARHTIHKMVRNFRLPACSFTNGSEVKPTRGFNSLESKLSRSVWHCTPDCFPLFARLAYDTVAIKRATRKRFAKAMCNDLRAIRDFHRKSWKRYMNRADAQFLCFQRMLSVVTFRYDASRFSSVRKNNEKDRPIALEGFCNMLVQRQLGLGLKDLLMENFKIDLDSLAAKHRRLISDANVATIDLKNASDSISCWLVEFLFPRKFLKLLYAARAPYLEDFDGHYHVLQKISSMGCGFTFELMTLILQALGREHDKDFSVFGDDIIVSNDSAQDLIRDLEFVGFIVNREKSHVRSKFRESCGANWHDSFGYIKSFDFWYPENIHDCIVVYNKAALLGESYPQFKALSVALARTVPHAWQGPKDVTWEQVTSDGARDRETISLLSDYFRTGRSGGGLKVDDRKFSGVLDRYHLVTEHRQRLNRRYFIGFKWRPKLASRTLDTLVMKRHYGKYAMYLHGGRRIDDSITGRGAWQKVTWAQVGQRAFRVKTLVALSK